MRDKTDRRMITGLKRLWQWYRMPVTVFFIGILSIALLTWVSRLSEGQLLNSALLNASTNLQTSSATFHLWIEEAIGGDATIDIEKTFAELDEAISTIDAILSGRGEFGHRLFLGYLEEPELRTHAEAIKALLIQFKMMARERLQEPEKGAIGSALDQQFDGIFKKILGRATVLENIIETKKIRNQSKSRHLLLGILFAWISVVIAATAGLFSGELRRRSAEKALHEVNEQLLSQAEELKGHREYLEELVDKRTCKLWESEKQLRQLYAQLMTAQETERRRISRELHDELGQALNVMKLRLQFIGGKLRGDQGAIKEDCENLIGHAGQVIENVRRLSRDLSPSVLEDLGLTAALQWLMKHSALNITSDIIDIDHLFSQDSQIMVYRIIQEALTNISKHAGAENVLIVIQRHEENLFFSVEDDGKGFDLIKVTMMDAAEKGLGLATMNERVKMLGGVFDLWSQEGIGTRITFSVPVEAAGGS